MFCEARHCVLLCFQAPSIHLQEQPRGDGVVLLGHLGSDREKVHPRSRQEVALHRARFTLVHLDGSVDGAVDLPIIPVSNRHFLMKRSVCDV